MRLHVSERRGIASIAQLDVNSLNSFGVRVKRHEHSSGRGNDWQDSLSPTPLDRSLEEAVAGVDLHCDVFVRIDFYITFRRHPIGLPAILQLVVLALAEPRRSRRTR
jgi:hypothetical protein